LNEFKHVVLVLANLHCQGDFGEVCGCLDIFGDGSSAPGYDHQKKYGNEPVWPA